MTSQSEIRSWKCTPEATLVKVIETALAGVLIIEPRIFRDPRGFFMETWHQTRYREAGLPAHFVQDNLSLSQRGTLRGLHFQNHPQAPGQLLPDHLRDYGRVRGR